MKLIKLAAVLGTLCLFSACSSHGSSKPIQTTNEIPLPGVGSKLAYTGPQGIFDVPNSTFEPLITILDNGEVYGMDLINNRVAGFFHGTVSANGTTLSSSDLTEYNAYDGGYVQAASLAATYTAPSLKVSLTFPFGTFSSSASEQKNFIKDDKQTIYSTPIATARFAGNYEGELSSVGTEMKLYSKTGAFAISTDGKFTASAGDCDFAGTLAPHGDKGVFDITANVSGATCTLIGQMQGLMTPVSLETKTTLGFQLLATDAKKSAMLFVTKS